MNYKRLIIVSTTFLGGLYFFLEFILPSDIAGFKFGAYHLEISKGVQVIGAMAIGIGIINILKVHGGNIVRTSRNWIFSLALILGLFLTLIIDGRDFLAQEERVSLQTKISQLESFVEKIEADYKTDKIEPIARLKTLHQFLASLEHFPALKNLSKDSALKSSSKLQAALEAKTDSKEAFSELKGITKTLGLEAGELLRIDYEESPRKRASSFLFEAFYVPLGAAMFSLLACYIASAAYRSFRIKSFEAFILMVAAMIVMLGQIPHGILYVSEDLPAIRLWLLKNINGPAFRAINFCSLVAGLALAMRMWLSMERGPLTVDDDS